MSIRGVALRESSSDQHYWPRPITTPDPAHSPARSHPAARGHKLWRLWLALIAKLLDHGRRKGEQLRNAFAPVLVRVGVAFNCLQEGVGKEPVAELGQLLRLFI